MRRLFPVFIILVLAVAGYLLYDRQQSQPPAPEPLADLVSEPEDAALAPADTMRLELREEAQRYIEEITERKEQPLEVDRADDFVRADEPITLFPRKEFQERTLSELQRELDPGSPLTIMRQQEQVELTTPKELLAAHGGNLEARIKILEGGQIRETTVGAIIEQRRPDAPISVIRSVDHLEVTTVGELAENDTVTESETLKVISEPYRLQSTTVGELLMGEQGVSSDSVFYVRNVSGEDIRGLWGIVHNGLVKNFASGIAIRRGEEVRNYQVEIPPGADARLEDLSSSYLGKMIDRKTRESYVYNYRKGSMGRNPDLIYPGQEIVIVGFTPEELVEIYEHFVARSGFDS